jgi:serine protease
VKIIPVRVLATGGGSEADIVAGLNWAAGIPISGIPLNPHPANVINMSIGGQGTCNTGSPTQLALMAIKNKGITVVTASGNDSDYGSLSYPGNCYPTINVAASGKSGKPTFYSNFGDAVDIAAPGGDYCYQLGPEQVGGQIYSTLNDGTTIPGNPTYGYELGTSMASPNVAGVLALMYSALFRKNPTVAKNSTLVTSMWTALSTTVTPLASNTPPATPSNGMCVVPSSATAQNYGAGIVNAAAAVAAIIQ